MVNNKTIDCLCLGTIAQIVDPWKFDGLKSFCLRDRGRLGNEGQPILLKFGTQSRYVDLCSMPKF